LSSDPPEGPATHRRGRGPRRSAARPAPLRTSPYQSWDGRYDDPDGTWRVLYLAGDAYRAGKTFPWDATDGLQALPDPTRILKASRG